MQHALHFMPSGELADPRAVADVAAAAEQGGWDGVFLWDHVLRHDHEPNDIADPWVAMAAMAMVTDRVRLGPMVTPITRRRPIKLAREAISVDHLSRGRLTLGLGLGVDHSRELSGFGEVVDARTRGDRLDEGTELLTRMWSGETLHHRGDHFVADEVRILPTPVQQPRIPLWFAARGDARRPVRRAARYDGLVPVDVDIAQLATMIDVVRAERGNLDGFDIARMYTDDDDLARAAQLGVTWALHARQPGVTLDQLLSDAATGPH